MTAHELLLGLLEALGEQFPEVGFREACLPEPVSRLPESPTVIGTIREEESGGSGWKAKLLLTVFLPRHGKPEEAEPLLSGMMETARQRYPQFTGAVRGEAVREKATGLLKLPCTLEFAVSGGGSGGGTDPAVWHAVLGGREVSLSGVRTSVVQKGEELVSIGEEEPFAVLGRYTEYTVELRGLDTAGLELLASFTAQLGEPPQVYRNCRWKSISPAEKKAVFVSRRKAEQTEEI